MVSVAIKWSNDVSHVIWYASDVLRFSNGMNTMANSCFFLHGWEKNRYDWEFWYIGYNTNHHQWRGSSNSSLDLSNMISVYFAIHKASMRYPRSCVQLLNQIPGFHGKDLITWISGWTTCLSCHFCSFFSNTLGGHTCSCSWHSAYEKSYSHVAMSCGCSWDLSNSETLCSHACDLSISTIPSRHYRSGR